MSVVGRARQAPGWSFIVSILVSALAHSASEGQGWHSWLVPRYDPCLHTHDEMLTPPSAIVVRSRSQSAHGKLPVWLLNVPMGQATHLSTEPSRVSPKPASQTQLSLLGSSRNPSWHVQLAFEVAPSALLIEFSGQRSHAVASVAPPFGLKYPIGHGTTVPPVHLSCVVHASRVW